MNESRHNQVENEAGIENEFNASPVETKGNDQGFQTDMDQGFQTDMNLEMREDMARISCQSYPHS